MDYSQPRKSSLQETMPQTKLRKMQTPSASPPNLTFRNTPSPDRFQVSHKHKSTLLKPFGDQPNSTSQRTPIGLSPSQMFSARTDDDLDILITEQRVQSQGLLLQIGRLRSALQQAHSLRQIEVRKIKQEYQETSYLQVSQIRQNQHGQAEVFELQIRRLKQQLADTIQELQKVTTLNKREKDRNESQKNRFNEEVRQLIEKKNTQIYELKQDNDNKIRDFEQERANEIEQIKYTCEKEVNNLNRQIQKHQEELGRVKTFSDIENRQKQKIISYLEGQRNSIERRYERRLQEQTIKYQNIRNKFNQLINQFSEDSESSRTELKNIFESEYGHMMNLVKAMQRQNTQLRKQLQSTVVTASIEKQTLKEENSHLNKKIKDVSDNCLGDMEMLKVKLAALHESDLKNLKELYEMKLKHSSNNMVRLDEEVSKLRQFTNLLTAQKYELRKKFQVNISSLNSKIMKLRMGMSVMETEYKQNIDKEKSLMLMTSRSFLKEAEAKENSNKFLEEQIRKLRQLMDLQGRQNQNAQRAIEQRVMVANNELERLSSKVVIIAKQKNDLQNSVEKLRAEKDQEIQRLRVQLAPVCSQEQGGVIPQLKIIEQLRKELSLKKDDIGLLNDKMSVLESRLKEMQAESQRLNMENNMHTEQLRQQFDANAQKHLHDFKRYYEQKLQRLEQEKVELKKIVSSQYEQITQLVKKYKQTQEDLKQAIVMMKKRTALDQKVLNVGLDVNLIKNMVDLLPTHKAS